MLLLETVHRRKLGYQTADIVMSIQNRSVTDKKNITHLNVYVHQSIARCGGHESVQDQPYAGISARQTGC
jgi:hypothetical protein